MRHPSRITSGVIEVTMIEDQSTAALLDGRYRIEECVGRGGTAVVYRAEDTALGRTVAIKMLRRPEEMPIALERAHGESALLATVSHPSLVTLYDARLAPGRPQYLAMEYVHGPTLAARLSRGPLTSQEAAGLAHDIARGLQAVHDAGIIHRDVKPSNILMSADTGPGRLWTAKLTDFGIAFGMDDPRLTSPGIAVGTAAYMAPEQVRSDRLTPAVDVYALGLVLLEALTGEPAFPMSGGVQTALRRLTGPPEIPDSLGTDWKRLLEGMTRTEPAERPTARDVAERAISLGHRAGTSTMAMPASGDAAPEHGERMPEAGDGDPPAATRAYPIPTTRAARRSARRSATRGRSVRIAALGTAFAAAASIVALVGSHSMTGPAEPPARTAVVDAPSTPSPTPIAEQVQTTVPDGGTGSTAPATDGEPVAVVPARNAGPDPASASNPNKGPGSSAGGGDSPAKGKAAKGGGSRDANAGKPGSGAQDG